MALAILKKGKRKIKISVSDDDDTPRHRSYKEASCSGQYAGEETCRRAEVLKEASGGKGGRLKVEFSGFLSKKEQGFA